MIYQVKLLDDGFGYSDFMATLAFLLSFLTTVLFIYDRIQAYRKQRIRLRFTVIDKNNDVGQELFFITLCFVNESSAPLSIITASFDHVSPGAAPPTSDNYQSGTLRDPDKQLPIVLPPYSAAVHTFAVNYGGYSSGIIVHQKVKFSALTSRGEFSVELVTNCDNYADFWYSWKAKFFLKTELSTENKFQRQISENQRKL